MQLSEIFDDDESSPEWRAWVDAAGNIHEIPTEETHAEYAYYGHPAPAADPDDDDEGDKVDLAFSHAMQQGWIRVGIPPGNHEFFVNCFDSVTVPALRGLLKLLNTQYADSYGFDYNGDYQTFSTEKAMKAFIGQLIASKASRTRSAST